MMENIATENLSEEVQVQDQGLAGLADNVMARIAKFFSETMDDEDFCGIAVDQAVDSDGKILSITLIPVDDIGGTPTRRVARG